MNTQEVIQKWSSDYTSFNSFPKIEEYEGVVYYPVGHNSSHTFYAGIDNNGQLYRMTVGDEFNEEINDYQGGVKRTSKIDNLTHYWGHY